MAKDVIITPSDGDIQFENSSGTEAGKIEQSGDDLVLSNAVGDILIGDGTADVYIGDGSANVDIVFEQNGSIRGEAGSSVDITLGSSDTDVIISGSTFNINPNATFAGDVTVSKDSPILILKNTTNEHTDGGAESKIVFKDHANNSLGKIEVSHNGNNDNALGNMYLQTSNGSTVVTALELNSSQNATFTGTVYIPSKLEHTGDSDTFLNFSDDTITLSAGGSSTTFAGNGNVTFPGDVTVSGDLLIGNTSQDPKDIIISQIGASSSENTSLMLDGNGVVVTRNLGSNAFNSTTIPTDHGDHAGLYLPIGGGTLTGDLHISNNAAPADDLTLLTLQNGNSTGDISTPNTFIDFEFKDSNANVVPQARIGAHAGDGGDADSQVKEGKGYLTFHTSDTTATSGTVAPPERVRIAHNGNVGIDKPNPNHKLDINQGELRISNNQLDPKIILQGADMGRRWVLSQDEEDNIGSTGFYIAEGNTVDANDALLYLTPSGELGIGTTSPVQKLEVAVTDTVALANQPAEPLFVSNNGISVDGRVLISVKHTAINTASAVGAGLKMTAGAVTTGTPSYFDSLIYLESAGPGSDTIHSAPKAIKFYVDNHGTGAGDGTNYGQLGDLAMTIAESANVGIATDTPDYKLEVNGALGVARLSGIIFAGSAGTGTGNKIYGDTSNNFIISTAATSAPYSSNERLRILSSNGNVGIGATNPSAKLEVNGDIALSGNNKVYSENDSLTLMAGGTNGTYVTVDDANGGVGIGITSPGYALDVDGTIRGVQYLRLADTGGTNRFNIRATSTFGTLDMGALTFNYIANAHLFLRGASEVMRIHSNSNVGIGTSNPQKKLHVSSGDQLTARIRLSNTNTASGGDNIELVAGVHNVTQDGFSIYNASGGATQFVIQGGGNVGIGVTSPSAKLEVGGTTTTQNLAFKKPTADNQFRGEIVTFGSQSGIAQGDIVAYNSSGQWVKAQANSGTTSKNLLGVAMGTTAAAGILLRGFVRDASFGAQTVSKGQHLYLSTSTSGDYQTAVPSTTGHIARIIGYSVDPTVEEIYFCPDNTFVEIA